MLSDEQINTLVNDYFNKTLKQYEDMRLEGIGTPTLDDLQDPWNEENDSYGSHYEGCNVAIEQGMQALLTSDWKYIEGQVNEVLEEQGISLDKTEIDYKRLCREMLKAYVILHRIEKKRILEPFSRFRADGEPSGLSKLSHRVPINLHTAPLPVEHKVKSSTLSQLIKKFLDEKRLTKKNDPKTIADSEGVFKVLVQTLGNLPVDEITKDHALRFLEVVNKIPKNMNVRKKFRNKTIDEVIRIVEKSKGKDKLLSDTSRAKYIERVSMLMKWAVEADLIGKNFFSGLSVEHDTEEAKRRPFTTEELKRLRASPVYQEEKITINRAHEFFIILIALFTAMRMNEICQLYVNDIIEVDSIPCIDINKDVPDKRLKNKSARRTVPIHPVLVKIGFLDYVRMMKGKGHDRLWIGLKFKKENYKQDFSSWFAKYCDDHITNDSMVNFHTLRNTVTDNLKQQGVIEPLVAAIDGHKHPNITFATYGQAYRPKPLLEVLMKLDYAYLFRDLRFRMS